MGFHNKLRRIYYQCDTRELYYQDGITAKRATELRDAAQRMVDELNGLITKCVDTERKTQ